MGVEENAPPHFWGLGFSGGSGAQTFIQSVTALELMIHMMRKSLGDETRRMGVGEGCQGGKRGRLTESWVGVQDDGDAVGVLQKVLADEGGEHLQ